jgi:hypothetical protein
VDPNVDIYEDKEGITISVDLPGIVQKDVRLNIDNNVLTLSSERKLEHEDKKRIYHGPGGQKLAVADALTYILRNKASKTSDTKVKKLQKQLTKERMKKSPVAGVAGAEEKGSEKTADRR